MLAVVTNRAVRGRCGKMGGFSRFGVALLLTTALSGCASTMGGPVDTATVRQDMQSWNAKVYQDGAELTKQTQTRIDQQTSADDEVLTKSQAVRRSVPLGELYEAGIRSNYDIVLARKGIAVANADLTNATLAFFPSLNGTVSAVYTDQNILSSDNQVFQQGEAKYPTYNALLEARMPLFNLENVFNRAKATAETRKAQVEYIGAAQTYVRDLISAYLDLAEANAVIFEYQTKIGLVGTRVTAEQKVQGTAGGQPEIVASFEQQLSDLRAHLASDMGRRDDATARIYELTGMKVTGVTGAVKVSSLHLPANNFDDLRTLAGQNNVQYLAKQYEADMSQGDLNASRAHDFGPKVNAIATGEYEDRKGSQFGGGATTVQGTVGVELKVPIFNTDGTGYKSLPADAQYEQKLAELGKLRREIESDLNRAYSDYRSDADRLGDDNRTVAKGDQILSLVSQRVANENAPSTEGLQAKLDQAEFIRQRQQTIFDLLRQWLAVKYLVGALSENDIAIFSPLPPLPDHG